MGLSSFSITAQRQRQDCREAGIEQGRVTVPRTAAMCPLSIASAVGQRRVQDPEQLELQAVVRCPTWMNAGSQPQSCTPSMRSSLLGRLSIAFSV